MTTARYLVRTRHPKREGRKVLGIATGSKPPAYDEVHLLAPGVDDPPENTEPALTVLPRIRERQRTGTHEVGGRLGDGATLERRGYQRYELLGPDGRSIATVRIRTLPHRLRIETASGQRVDLRNRRATLNPVKAVKRGLDGGLLATWEGDDGLRVEYHGGRSYVIVDTERCRLDLRTTLVTAVIAAEHSIDPSDLGD